ncbi:hypothetical protein FHX73_13391 [Kitasatospora viridis]|uniref:Uncharacterized protein n=1 Tax=Kitasatospora viridis TaxID=281105 RepID=A0A561TTC5_9ACTN|nr:hypothetical protein FHX73_13391 [Kitasatospora viridis]
MDKATGKVLIRKLEQGETAQKTQISWHITF